MGELVSQLEKYLREQPRLGEGVYLARTAVVLGDVRLGDHSSIWYGAVARGDINRVEVGHHSNVQDNAVLHVDSETPCIIGNMQNGIVLNIGMMANLDTVYIASRH